MQAPRFPAFSLVYGPPGYGKTVDMGFSFPVAEFYVGKGSLKSVAAVCGWDPYVLGQVKEPQTIPEATAFMLKSRFPIIVVDDFSWLAECSMNALDRRYAGNSNKFAKFDAARDEIITFRDAARSVGKHVILNAWEQGPKFDQNTTPPKRTLMGGPQLQGNLPEKMPGLCDHVFRAIRDPMRKPWPIAYQSGVSEDWVLKDRDDTISVGGGLGTTTVDYPMNLGEILRAAGYSIPRHPSVADWQETLVDNLAETFLAAGPMAIPQIGNNAIKFLRESGVSDLMIRWTLRDAQDRFTIRQGKKNVLASFGWGA